MTVESTLTNGLKKSVFGSQWKTEYDTNIDLLDAHLGDAANPHAVTKTQVSLGNVEDLKVNLAATAAPAATDDSGAGYAVGSRWIDVTNDKEYVCLDSTATLAVWTETTAGAAGGETNTASNAGTAGVGVFKAKSGVDLQFKNVNAGSNKITITDDAANNEIDIDVAEANISHANITGAHNLTTDIDHNQLTNYNVTEHRLINDAGTAATDLWSASKINTHLTDTGNPHVVTKSDVSLGNVEDLKVNLVATTNPGATDDSAAGYSVGSRWINTTANTEYVCVDSTATAAVWVDTTAGAAGGEANTASNVGTAGVGVFKTKSGVDLQFKNVNAGSNKVTITDDVANNEIDVDVAEGNLTHDNIGGTLGIAKGGTGATTAQAAIDALSAVSGATVDHVLTKDASGNALWKAAAGGVTDHGALTGLTDDDHTQYSLLAGRSGGQTFKGGINPSDDLIIVATAGAGDGTEAIIFAGGNNGVDEWGRFVNGNLGIGVIPATTISTSRPTQQVGQSGVLWGGASVNFFHLASNAVDNGTNWTKLQNDLASGVLFSGGNVIFRYAPTGTGTFSWTESMRIDSSGHVTPGADNTHNLGSGSLRWKEIFAGVGTINTSDARQKENIMASDLGLDFIMALNPISYKFKDTETITHTRPHYGFTAQDVIAAVKSLGVSDFAGYIADKTEDYYGLRYTEFIAPMVKAIHELKAELDALKTSAASGTVTI